MPYGYVLSLPTPRPLVPSMSLPLNPVMLPVVCRLSPRIPGYVMTVCEETRVENRERHVVATRRSGCDGAIVTVVVGRLSASN